MAINSWSRNRKLVLTWSTFLFLFLTTAVVLLVTASIWRGGDQQLGARTLQRLVWTDQFSNGQSTISKLRIRLLDLQIIDVDSFCSISRTWRSDYRNMCDRSSWILARTRQGEWR